MDGLIGPNAPMPKPPTAASGISEILFDIGGILTADPRNPRGDLGADLLSARRQPRPEHDFAWLMIAGLYEQCQLIPKAIAALGKIGPELAALVAGAAAHRRARRPAGEIRPGDQQAARAGRREARPHRRRAHPGRAAARQGEVCRGRRRPTTPRSAASRTIEERHWPMFFGRGIVEERTKQWPKAEADMKKALELSPEQPHVLNYLGYSWIDQGLQSRGRHEDAEARDRASARRRRDHRFGRLGLSTGSASTTRPSSGCERASEQKGDDATMVEHLGDAYWHVGRLREARFQWNARSTRSPTRTACRCSRTRSATG